ncbi:MAG: class I SAM-dependent methyltransferase [Symbiopectobacterium sp.]|uniref:class I SAM-dependent methyltransferase n=1 Tax=Symbiopectobacterium sp. TaxID=2952789 RepID=UPI003F32733A
MATIKDVAKCAGVSTTTVSHVINKTRFVAEETKTAVREAIKELHYFPSVVARSLKVNHTKSIGLLSTSSEAPYFAESIEAVENSCYAKGYTLILCNSHNNLEKQRAYLSMLAQKRVHGLLVMCAEYPPELLSMLADYRTIPMVVMDWGQAHSDFTDTIIDNAFEGGYLAGRYLIERGHRDIGTIPGIQERNTGSGHYLGFLKALQEADITVRDYAILLRLQLAQVHCSDLNVTIELQDYRDLNRHFDRIVSVSRFEHVGPKNYDTYFRVVSKNLKLDGLFLLHTIGANKTDSQVDPWINKYIFPNGCLPSVRHIAARSEPYLVMEDWHNFGADYDKTLMAWHDRFAASWPQLTDRYSPRFNRMFRYYLNACAGAFRARNIQLWQVLFSPQGIEGGVRVAH